MEMQVLRKFTYKNVPFGFVGIYMCVCGCFDLIDNLLAFEGSILYLLMLPLHYF